MYPESCKLLVLSRREGKMVWKLQWNFVTKKLTTLQVLLLLCYVFCDAISLQWRVFPVSTTRWRGNFKLQQEQRGCKEKLSNCSEKVHKNIIKKYVVNNLQSIKSKNEKNKKKYFFLPINWTIIPSIHDELIEAARRGSIMTIFYFAIESCRTSRCTPLLHSTSSPITLCRRIM